MNNVAFHCRSDFTSPLLASDDVSNPPHRFDRIRPELPAKVGDVNLYRVTLYFLFPPVDAVFERRRRLRYATVGNKLKQDCPFPPRYRDRYARARHRSRCRVDKQFAVPDLIRTAPL